MAWFNSLGKPMTLLTLRRSFRQEDKTEENAELEDKMQLHQEFLDEYSSEVPKLANMLNDAGNRLDEAVEKDDVEWQQQVYDDIWSVCTKSRKSAGIAAKIKANSIIIAQQSDQPGTVAQPQ